MTAKQTVRNVESALIAHLGMRVSHKKISVATSDESQRPQRVHHGDFSHGAGVHAEPWRAYRAVVHAQPCRPRGAFARAEPCRAAVQPPAPPAAPQVVDTRTPAIVSLVGRRIYFEDRGGSPRRGEGRRLPGDPAEG